MTTFSRERIASRVRSLVVNHMGDDYWRAKQWVNGMTEEQRNTPTGPGGRTPADILQSYKEDYELNDHARQLVEELLQKEGL